MSYDTKESYCAPVPALAPLSARVEPPTKFSKRGDLTGRQLLEGGCWKRGGGFFQRGGGGVQFLH